ncbi:MAG: hypothetical protein SGJ00_03200 [bacterium]|nr:hypothetical protein [bacterium]
MESSFIWPILSEIDSMWLSIAAISILFIFFFVKVKFQKKASLKAYGILFYAFVFYSISALSYVLLNALSSFFRLQNEIYSSFIWFFPISILSALIGALVGGILYWAGTKIVEQYVFKLMNLSLLILAPYLVYVLLIKPYQFTIALATQSIQIPAKPALKNMVNLEELNQMPTAEMFVPAMPSQLFDSLIISTEAGNKIKLSNRQNGFYYTQPLLVQPVEQFYISPISANKQLAVLALTPSINGQSQLLILDSLGLLIYHKEFNDFVNRMSVSSDNRYLVLQNSNDLDSLTFKLALRLQP